MDKYLLWLTAGHILHLSPAAADGVSESEKS